MIPDEKLKETVHQLEPVIGPRARILWYKYLNASTPERKEAWRRRIKILAEKVLDNYTDEIRLPPPTPEQTSGDYQLGLVIYPDKPYSIFGLREEEFCKHVMITGMTGTGKTTAALKIIKELKRHGKNFVVFDWQREYKKLRKLEEFKDLKILRVGKDSTFRFNPLIPTKGTDVGEWLAKLVDVINHAYLGSYGTEYILRDILVKAYKHTKTLETGKEYPTFKLVKEYLKKNFFRGRMEFWNQTAIRILESLTYDGGLGPVLNTEKKTNMKELLKEDIVIELDALSSDDKKFLTEAMLLWIYEFRKNQGETSEFRHAIIVEEAHNILSKKKEKTEGGETIMESTLRMIRKFGEAVIVIDQEPSKLSESMKANTNTKITFTLGNGKDIEDISKSMEIDKEQRKYLDILKVGHAIIKVKGRIEKPVMVYFPKFENNQLGIREDETGGVSLGSEEST
jgi:type IV secretory pathway VirB4 component